jgi:hypothetical protein
MTAIIDQHIDRTNCVGDRAKERTILLIADEDLRLPLLELLTSRVNVHAINGCLSAKVVAPHLERPTERDTDLYNYGGLPSKPCEMMIVDREVVCPFLDSTFRVPANVTFQRIIVLHVVLPTVRMANGNHTERSNVVSKKRACFQRRAMAE